MPRLHQVVKTNCSEASEDHKGEEKIPVAELHDVGGRKAENEADNGKRKYHIAGAEKLLQIVHNRPSSRFFIPAAV